MATPVDDLLNQVRERGESAGAQLGDLLRPIREHFNKAQDSINSLVRVQVAQGLAATFLERSRPFEEDARLVSLVHERLLNEAAFMQKSPALLRFYIRILASLRPTRVLEIGVKGGGSTAFWKQLFPDAHVVGFDIDLRSRLGGDGVTYVKGDQSDAGQLTALAAGHGPFDLVIDDGSHESAHQAVTLRTLIAHVTPGGLYVIEDLHENLKPEKGVDIWPEFIVTLLQRMRSAKAPVTDGPGAQLARDVSPRVDDLLMGGRAIALRLKSEPLAAQ